MTDNTATPLVGVIMGSDSDWTHVAPGVELLKEFGIPYEARVISAHRTPDLTLEYAQHAESRGLQVIIAAAGGAAALPGVIAASTLVPVLGVPIPAWSLDGLDSLLSMVQMPGGVPVGTLSIGKHGAVNAAILAAEIVGLTRPEVRKKLAAYRAKRREAVLKQTLPG